MAPIPGPGEGLNAAVAAQLRAERAAAEMTIDELATSTDLSEVSVRRYLKGQRHIDVAVLDALARALGTTADAVLDAAIWRMNHADRGVRDLTSLSDKRRQPRKYEVPLDEAAREED